MLVDGTRELLYVASFLVIYLIVTVLIIFSIIAIITTLNFLPLLLVAFIYHPIKYVCLGYVVITFIPNLSLLIRRFHDIGRTSICPLVLYVTYFIISYVVIFDPLNCFEKANFEILKHALILMTIAIVIFLIAFISLDSKKDAINMVKVRNILHLIMKMRIK